MMTAQRQALNSCIFLAFANLSAITAVIALNPINRLAIRVKPRDSPLMDDSEIPQTRAMTAEILPPGAGATAPAVTPNAAGQAALAAAEVLARQASAPATLRAYKADWAHFAAWCADKGFVPVPAAPAVVGAYLGSLADSHAPTTIRRRLAALGKMHRFNDLPWNPGHRDIQGPLQGALRTRGRPVQKAAALSLAMLRQLVATCDQSARGRRDRALLLFGFAGAMRRSELVSLRVEDVAVVPGGLRVRIRRAKTDQTGQGAEIGLPRGRHAETCPVRAFEAWQAVAKRQAGPLFRKISTGGGIGDTKLHPDAVRRILAHRVAMAGLSIEGFDRLSAHALRVGFITAAYDTGIRDEDIMRHTRHRDLRTMRGYVQRAGLVTESPAGGIDL
jgi:integrase